MRKGARVRIGLTKTTPNTRNEHLPSSSSENTLGIGFRNSNGGIYHNSTDMVECAERFTVGDIVGCFVFHTHINGVVHTIVQLTKNGRKQLSHRFIEKGVWYPTVGISMSADYIYHF